MTLYDVFSSRSQFSNIQRDVPKPILYVLGAKHIRITEAAPKNSPSITLETFGSPIAFIPPLSDRWCLVKDCPAVLVPWRTRHNRRDTEPGRMADRIPPPMQAMRK